MSRTAKFIGVTLLALCLTLTMPVAAFAQPTPPNIDPPMVFSAQDMTEAMSVAVGSTVVEVTAISSPIGDLTLIAGLDNDGRVVLASWDGSQFRDWTANFNEYIGNNWTRINAIAYFNEDYFVGGTRLVDTQPVASIAYLCGLCYGSGRGSDQNLYSDSTLASHTAVTGMSYEGDTQNMAVTVAGSNALLLANDVSNWDNEYDPTFTVVTDPAMASAQAPIGLYGNEYSFNIDGKIEAETANVSSQAGAVKTLTAFPPYWAFGTSAGDVLAYGCDGGSAVAGQTLTTIAGTTDVMALNYDWVNSAWMVGAKGTSGTMRLFRDTHVPTVSAGSVAVSTTEVPFPATITENADAAFAGYYYMVGGTGAAGHLYKYNQVFTEMIDLDYLVSGMSKVNVVKQDNGVSQSGPFNGFGTSYAFVGGAGDMALVRVTESAAYNVDPIPAGEGTTANCPAGGASVTVPAGAVGTDYSVIVEKVAAGTPAVPGGLSLLGTSYEFKCFDTSGNPITAFDQPVTITISYDQAALNGMSEDSLIIYYFDTADSTWKAVTPCVVDKVNHTVTITVSHFTQFGVLGATATALPYTGI
jgi:hypothetical protein